MRAAIDTVRRLASEAHTSFAEQHNAYTAYLAFFLLATTGLRAVSSLLPARFDVDGTTGLCFVSDKDNDAFSSAVIVLLSDGENKEFPEPLDIAQIAAEAGVRVYTGGIGSPEGAQLEIDGFSVVTQLNEVMLQEIASVTNGRYYFATDEEELRDIYQNIDLQLTIRGESMEVTSILAGISLVFMLVSGALSLLWFGAGFRDEKRSLAADDAD